MFKPTNFIDAIDTNYGNNEDALHKESLPNNVRYNKCHKFINRIVLKKE